MSTSALYPHANLSGSTLLRRLLAAATVLGAASSYASSVSEVLRSEALFDMGAEQYQSALSTLEMAVKSDPKDQLSHYYHGVVLARLGRYQEALEALQKAGDEIRGAAFERGMAFYRLKQHAKALSALQRAVEAEPKRAAAHYYLGICYIKLEQPRSAIEPLTRAMALQSDLAPSSIYMIAGAHAGLGELGKARTLLHKGVADYPNSVYAGAMLDQLSALEGAADSRAFLPTLSLGLTQDDNVGLFPTDQPLPGNIDSGSDARVELTAGGDYRLAQSADDSLLIGYQLFASHHSSLSDYDLLRHQLAADYRAKTGFGSWGLGYQFHSATLAGESYTSSHTLNPTLIYRHKGGQHSLLRLSLGSTRYAQSAMSGLDNSRQSVRYRFIIPLEGADHWYIAGQLGREDSQDPQLDASLQGLSAGAAWRLAAFRLNLGADYQFHRFSSTLPVREDEQISLNLGLTRALNANLSLHATLTHIDHPSSWLSYQYNRNLVNVTVRWQP